FFLYSFSISFSAHFIQLTLYNLCFFIILEEVLVINLKENALDKMIIGIIIVGVILLGTSLYQQFIQKKDPSAYIPSLQDSVEAQYRVEESRVQDDYSLVFVLSEERKKNKLRILIYIH